MRKTILFRADGNSEIGLGHMYRMYALFEMLDSYFNTAFLSKNTDFVKENFDQIENIYTVPDGLSKEDEPIWISNTFSESDHILVTDGYSFNTKYQKEIKSYGYTLVCIDDLADQHMFADLVINHSLAIQESDYSAEKYTQFALGSNYALLRKSFNDVANEVDRTIKSMDTAFICFGGADPKDLTLKSTVALLNLEEIKRVNVVIGKAYTNRPILQVQDSRLQIHKNIGEREMHKIMLGSNVAIAPASTISYELCSIRIPLYCGYYVDNQKLIYKGLLDNGLIIGCGDFNTFDFESINFKRDIDNPLNMINCQKKYFDDKIAQRLRSKIEVYA